MDRFSTEQSWKAKSGWSDVPNIFCPIKKFVYIYKKTMDAKFFLLLFGCVFLPVEGAETIDYRQPLAHLASIRSVNCPYTCYCTATTWNCDGANLTKLPTGYPRTIMYLNLHNNQIDNVPAGVFRDLPFLRIIDLRDNDLTTVKFRSFSDLPTLHTIYLSFNKISHIEKGAFQGMDRLRVLRLDHNVIPRLYKDTFMELPRLEEINLRDNPALCCVEPLTFNRLPELREIQMYKTRTNTAIFGTYEIGKAVSKTTFANGQDLSDNPPIPGCPKLGYIELGAVKLHSLYPNYFMSNNFLQMVRRIGQSYEVYSTDQEECDMLNKAAVFTDTYGATICMVAQAAQEDASPSRREKSHLKSHLAGGRLLDYIV